MGNKVSPIIPACNGSVHVELSGHATSSDAGVLILLKAMDSSQIMDWLGLESEYQHHVSLVGSVKH